MKNRKEIVLTGVYDVCTKCSQELDVAYFVANKSKKGYTRKCLDCQRKYAKARYDQIKKEPKKTRRAQLIEFKSKPCMDCKGQFDWWQMDFDHMPGYTKCFNLAAWTQHTWEEVLAEISKCELICANCHRTRTRKRKLGVMK